MRAASAERTGCSRTGHCESARIFLTQLGDMSACSIGISSNYRTAVWHLVMTLCFRAVADRCWIGVATLCHSHRHIYACLSLLCCLCVAANAYVHCVPPI